MRYLLDTHIYLWWLNNDKRLKATIRKIISDSNNIIYLSCASAWEISIKLKTNPEFKIRSPVLDYSEQSNFEILSITLNHIFELHKLPTYHKDPFDRILISQAQAENLTLITSDQKIWRYKISLLKA